jgi:hypothetical protein
VETVFVKHIRIPPLSQKRLLAGVELLRFTAREFPPGRSGPERIKENNGIRRKRVDARYGLD